MKKSEIKNLLPAGSYHLIAKKVGRSYGTVKGFFSSNETRISPETQADIIKVSKEIIRNNSLNGLKLLLGEKKTEMEMIRKIVKAA